jgi:thiamine phosphate synthase YjbQ (UPF0047 family)
MKSYFKELYFTLLTRRAYVNIMPEVDTCLRESGIREGLLLCNAKNITSFLSIFICEFISLYACQKQISILYDNIFTLSEEN